MSIRLALVGPTAVGKTELSLSLAEELKAEIICLDSRQIYEGFRIGTAQPTFAERVRVKHHLTDFLLPTQSFSAGEFLNSVRMILENSAQDFILVGGTGLYLQSLIEGLPKIPEIEESVRADVLNMYLENGLRFCYEKARELDAEAMKKISAEDKQRIFRVLEVAIATKRPLSSWQKEREGGLGEIPTFFLNRPREILYRQINERAEKMFENGWVEEVVELSERVPLDAFAWKSIGYREILEMLKGNISKEQCLSVVQQETRRFAKRQLTWFRHQVKASEIDLAEKKSTMVLKEILEKVG